MKQKILNAIHGAQFHVTVAGTMKDPDVEIVSLEESSEHEVVTQIIEAVGMDLLQFIAEMPNSDFRHDALSTAKTKEWIISEFLNYQGLG